MKISLTLLSLMLAAGSPALAKTEKVKDMPLPNGLVVHEYKLDNGMQLLLVPDHSAPVFSYQMWMKVGSATEKLDPKLKRSGLAHLFEHMMFRGTKKYPDGEFDKKLSVAGAVGLNATTWFDRTNYFESLPKEGLELTFQMESDRMVNLALDEKLFTTERGAVFGEKKMRDDKPNSWAYDSLWDLAFVNAPYKFTTIGTTEDLNSFTVKDAQYFYKTYYSPNNAALILIGDIDVAKAVKLAEKYYGPMKSQMVPKHENFDEPEQTEARRRDITHPLATADYVNIGYKIPGLVHPDMAALQTVGAVLGYGNGSWLEQELVQENIASGVSASPSMYRFPSLFIVSIQMVPGKDYKEAVKVVNNALARIRDGKVSKNELERAKNQFLLNSYSELMSSSEIGNNLGDGLVSADDYTRNFTLLEQIKKVTVQDLQRVAKTYLIDKHSNLLHLAPAAAEKGKK